MPAKDFRNQQAEAFLSALADPESTQRELLLAKIVGPNADSEFGQAHGFARIRSFDDFRAAVPIRKYEGFAPWIDRIVQRGEQGLLTTEPVKRFFLTSGSSAAKKYIPVTSSFVRTKSRAFGIYWSLVFDDHPEAKAGRMVTNFSDSGEPSASPGGLPCSSESAYWAGVTRATQRDSRPIVPKAVAQIDDSDARYYAIARILLEEEFSVIMTLNPSTILLLFDKLVEHVGALADDLERGGIDPGRPVGDAVRAELSSRYGGNPARAQQLRALAAEGTLHAHRIWPALALAISWRSPMLAPYLRLLAPHFADRVAGRDYILMASEGVMAVPLADGSSGGALAIDSHVYELVPEERYGPEDAPTLLPHELEVGRTYVVVLTNGSGLYRYDIGDVVRVVRFEGRTPVVEFLHRAGATCSLTGEKLTEDQVTAAMSEVAAELGLSVHAFTMHPAPEGFPRYVALVELSVPASEDAKRAFPRCLDEALHRCNVEYGSKRASERLAAPELWIVAPGGYEARRQARLRSGTSDSQIKPTHLTRDSAFSDSFPITERVHAGAARGGT
jgi:hypothetical protein